MGDHLERFILNNREEFEKDEPSEKVWHQLSRKNRKSDKWTGMWKVAAILLMISTMYLVLERKMDRGPETETLTDNHEFEQVEQYYTTLIAEKRREISQYNDQGLERDFLMEIDRLDRMYGQLKDTYHNQNSTDLITGAMISNLQLRIDILNKQLEILEKLKSQQNEKGTDIEI